MRILSDRLAGVDYLKTNLQPEHVRNPHEVEASVASDERALRKAVQSLGIAPSDRILDVGCGKGAAMRVLLEFPFERVDGLEISPQMAAMAQRNLTKLTGAAGRWQVQVTDARNAESLGMYTHIYLFNPFPGTILTEFMSLITSQCEVPPTIIYANPVASDVLQVLGWTEVESFPTHAGTGIAVYRPSR